MVVYAKRYPPSRRRRTELPVIYFRIDRGPIHLHPRGIGRSISTSSTDNNNNSNNNNRNYTNNSTNTSIIGNNIDSRIATPANTTENQSSNSAFHQCDPTMCNPTATATATAPNHRSPGGEADDDRSDPNRSPRTGSSPPRIGSRSPHRDAPDDEPNDLEKLREHCPESTHTERNRFLVAKKGDYPKAREQLTRYLEWRSRYGLDHDYHDCTALRRSRAALGRADNGNSNNNTNSNHIDDDNDDSEEEEEWHVCASDHQTLDELDWKFASQTALLHNETHDRSSPSPSPSPPPLARSNAQKQQQQQQQQQQQLPQLARIVIAGSHARDRDGHRILQLLPAMMDLSVASESTFALCIALYLDRKLGRDSDEKMSVFIDVRGGTGWANPTPSSLVPFVRCVSGCLEQNFPERLHRSVLFPMPLAAKVLWGAVRRLLDPATASKIEVVRGSAATLAAPPYARMEEHARREILERMEELRLASFGGGAGGKRGTE